MTKFAFDETDAIIVTSLGVGGSIGGSAAFSPFLSHAADHFEGDNLHTFEYLDGANAIMTIDVVAGGVTKAPVAYTLPRGGTFVRRHVPYVHQLGVWIGNAGGAGGIDLIRNSDGAIIDSYGSSSLFPGYLYDLSTLNTWGLGQVLTDGVNHYLVYIGALLGGIHLLPFNSSFIDASGVKVYNNEWLTWGVDGIDASSEKEAMHVVKTSDTNLVGFAMSEAAAVVAPNTVRILSIDLSGDEINISNESEIHLPSNPLLAAEGYGSGSGDVHSFQCHELTGPTTMFLCLAKGGDLYLCRIELQGSSWNIVEVEKQPGFRPSADTNFSCGYSSPIPAKFPLAFGENNTVGEVMLFDPTVLTNKQRYFNTALSLYDWIVPYPQDNNHIYYLGAAKSSHELHVIGFGATGNDIEFFPETPVEGNFGLELIIPSYLSVRLRARDYTGVLNQLIDTLGELLPTLADNDNAAAYFGLDANHTAITNMADAVDSDDLVTFGQVKTYLGIT